MASLEAQFCDSYLGWERHVRESAAKRRFRTTKFVVARIVLSLSALLFFGVTSIPLLGSIPSSAAPLTTQIKALPGGLTSLNLLPSDKPVALVTPSGDTFFSIYVPTGTIPVRFEATLLIRGAVNNGIATITTPTNVYPVNLTTHAGTTSFSAPLNAADVTNGLISIQVAIDLNLNEKYIVPNACSVSSDVVAQIETASAILRGSVQTPKVLADFWPPQLNQVNVYVPNLRGQSAAEQRSAELASMQVAAIVAQQYGTSTVIDIKEGAPPSQHINPLVRNVAIEPSIRGVTSELALVDAGTAPVLTIRGSGSALVAEARAISRSALTLATSSVVTSVSATSPTANPASVTVKPDGTRQITLAQLGLTTPLEGLGTVDQTLFLSQDQFGASIGSLQIRIQASYTPPPIGGVASFTVLIGNYVVASQRLGTSGVLTMDSYVPASVLSRSQTVDFRLDYSPPGGYCHSGLVPVVVTMTPSSGFSATPGQTLPAGFSRSPQNVASGFNVDLVANNDTNLIDACELIVSLSQILPFEPNVTLVSPSDATKGSETELVVGAGRNTSVKFHAPLVFQPFRSLSSNGTKVGYVVRQPFSAIESFVQNGRDVILAGAYAKSELTNRLLQSMRTTAFGGWYGLGNGQIALTTQTGKIRLVSSGVILSQISLFNPSSGLGIPKWLLLLIVVSVVAIISRALWFVLKMRRLRRQAAAELARAKESNEPRDELGNPTPNERPGS